MDPIVRQKLEEKIAVEKTDAVDFNDLYTAYLDHEIEYLQTLSEKELLDLATSMGVTP